MSEKPKILNSSRWASAVACALEIDAARIRRIVVDAEAGQPLKVYVEYYGDERLLSVGFPPRDELLVITQETT